MAILLATSYISLQAQQRVVSGTVTSADDNAPLPGVNVVVKGTTNGTVTDINGNYSMNASDEASTLVFSFIGFTSKDVEIGSRTSINVILQADVSQLNEVLVTAFGIKKETRQLGYSVSQVKAKDLNLSGQSNALEALQGRVAGLQINRSSGSAAGGVDILIRGVTSVDPSRSNQPLIIIDGLALNNDTFSGSGILPSSGSNSPSASEQFSFSNRAADINPDDIESFSVLKGAAATALYGVRASNGAIIITTKKGKEGKAKISLSSSTTMRKIVTTPELQTKYREGHRTSTRPGAVINSNEDDGYDDYGFAFYSWGVPFTDDSFTQSDATVVDLTEDRFYSPYDLFRTGINTQINFSISGASDKLDYLFSVSDNSEKGVMPNTHYDKSTLRLKAGYKISDNFSMNSSISYTNSGGSRANGGDKSVMSSMSYWSSTFPINDYKNADGSQRNYSKGIIDNPRYFLETSNLEDDVNRWIGNVTLNWAPKDWISVVYAAQVDNYSDQRNRFVAPDLDTGTQVGGFITEQDINFLALESNFLVTFTRDLSESFSSTLTLGNQVSDSKRDLTFVRGETLNVPGINDLANTINIFAGNSTQNIKNIGVFGEFKLDYKNSVFLTITGRNDWLSTLPKNNRSFFYPSVSLAYDFTDLVEENGILSFGKLRLSWAEVGKGPVFGKIGHFFVADGDFPFGGAGGFRSSTTLGDVDIVPERNQSIELGVDLRFLDNRIRLDYAYYKTLVKDQIFSVPTAVTSGLSSITRNAGDFETYGHELLLSADIIKSSTIQWETYITWSTNEGKVTDLPDDIEAVIFASSGFPGVTSEVREGDKMGTLYGYKWRYENGQRYIGDDGKPRVNLDERVVVGNAFPDFITSIGNTVSYKNFNFNFLLEWKKGGDLYDSGRRNSIRNGNLKMTEFRDEMTVLGGVMDDGSGGFIPNTQETLIDANSYYRSSTRYNRAAEILIQDASWLKLRNIGLTYNFKGNILEKLRLDNLSVSASAHNLLLWTPFEGFDPEANQYSAGSNVYGFTGLNTPISESYSLSLKLGF